MTEETSPLNKKTEETRWIDAWIRWERDSQHDESDDDESDNVPPVPTNTFTFGYKGTADQPDIQLELQGFPSDSEQTWNSTGLTLWRSSEHLCDYIVQAWKQPLSDSTPLIGMLDLSGLLAHQL